MPVINALSDMYHPCQALADMFTLQRPLWQLRGRKLAFIGDGNNVAHSLMLCAARLGMHFALAHPKGYEANPAILRQTGEFAALSGATLTMTNDPAEAVSRRRRGLHRCLDQHGPGRGKGQAAGRLPATR